MPVIRILNVCADQADLRDRTRLLEDAGFSVTEAVSAAEARAALAATPQDVLLLGSLGSGDFPNLCLEMKADAATTAVKILRIAPAGIDPVDQAACLASGSDLVLVEPVDPRVLVAQVTALGRAITGERAERRFLRTVIDSVASLIVVRDRNGCFLLVNEAAARFHGTTVGALQGRYATDIPTVPPEVLEADQDVLASGKGTRAEFDSKGADGLTHSLLVYRTPLKNSEGTFDRVLVTSIDMTWRKLADAALRESEERFSALFKKAPFAAALARMPGGVLADINEACEDMLGISRDEVIGKTTLELGVVVAPEERARIYEEVRVHGAARGVEARYRTRSGAVRVLSHHVSPVTLDGREYLIDAMQDVTERNRAEAARRESEQLLRSHVENSPLAVVEWDNDFIVTRWAGGAERIFGWTAAETTGRRIDALGMVFEDDMPVVQKVMEKLTDGVTRQAVSTNRNYTKDGRLIHCTWYNSVLIDDEGKMASVLSLVLDNTERERAEAALRAANAQLAEADRRKDEFIAVLSHELRNPLAPIRYAIPVLERELVAEASRRALAVIDRQAHHLTRLVDDLLDVSRISRGQVELRREQVTLASIVASAVEAASPVVTAARHALAVSVAEEPIWLHADPARLSQIVTNLLDNSAKYTPRGGELTVEAGRDGAMAFVRVRDNGVGIPADALPNVFDMFRQVSRPDKAQSGLGIGLGLVKTLIEMHGGSVEAHSDGPGRGATFTVAPPGPRRRSGRRRASLRQPPGRRQAAQGARGRRQRGPRRDAGAGGADGGTRCTEGARRHDRDRGGARLPPRRGPARPRPSRHERARRGSRTAAACRDRRRPHRGADGVGPGGRLPADPGGRLRRAPDQADRPRAPRAAAGGVRASARTSSPPAWLPPTRSSRSARPRFPRPRPSLTSPAPTPPCSAPTGRRACPAVFHRAPARRPSCSRGCASHPPHGRRDR